VSTRKLLCAGQPHRYHEKNNTEIEPKLPAWNAHNTDPKMFRVSLPREYTQEIKRMLMVQTTHGLFLTCTKNSSLYLHNA
jgi:hypothetical protein